MKSIPVRTLTPCAQQDLPCQYLQIDTLSDKLKGIDMQQDTHRHDFHFILFVEKGGGIHTIDFDAQSVGGPEIYILRPGQVHSLFLDADTQGFILQFGHEYAHRLKPRAFQGLKKIGRKNRYLLTSAEKEAFHFLFHSLHQENQTPSEDALPIMISTTELLIFQLLRAFTASSIKTSAPSYELEITEQLLQLLEENITEKKQVSDYTSLLHLTAYQLNHITKKTLGKTCSEMISQQIVLEAKRMLLATSNQVSQIAYQMGYEDPSYFIRFFKKHTGITPEKFRQNS